MSSSDDTAGRLKGGGVSNLTSMFETMSSKDSAPPTRRSLEFETPAKSTTDEENFFREEVFQVTMEKTVGKICDFQFYYGRNSRGTTGIFIRSIHEESAFTSTVEPEDQLLKINDEDIRNIEDSNLVHSMLQKLSGIVTLQLKRIVMCQKVKEEHGLGERELGQNPSNYKAQQPAQLQTSQQTGKEVCKRPSKMPRKNIDLINKNSKILRLAKLLEIDCEENPIEQIKIDVKQKINDQRKYLKTKTGFSVISKAREEDTQKSTKLKAFYNDVNRCLNQLDQQVLQILKNHYAGRDIFQVLAEQKKRLERKDYRILVAGESSAGKSSLINLILGEQLLPHHTLNTTSTITEIKHGLEKKIVLHHKYDSDQLGKPSAQHIPLKTVEEAGKTYREQIESFLHLEQTEREKGSKYEKVEIVWPHELLQEGVVIIDSPGLGESDDMDQVLMHYLPNAFAFMYVIDVSHAGGIQEDLKKKLIKIVEKVHSLDGGIEDYNNLAECSLFICNKWDLVPEREKKAVKQYIVKQLGKCWQNKNVENQILCMSIRNAIKVQEYGGVIKEFKDFLESMQEMILRAMNVKLFSHWKWLDFVLYQIRNTTSFYTSQMKSTQMETRHRMHSMTERVAKIEVDEQKVSAELQQRLQQETNSLFSKLCDFVQSEEFEKKLCTWTNSALPPTMDTWEETKTEVMKEIEYRFKQLLLEWESENKFCLDVHRRLVNEFLRRLNLLEEEINEASDSGPELTGPGLMDELDESSLSKSAKVLVGATSPFWVPVGIVSLVIGMPVLGAILIRNKVSDNRKLKEYQSYPDKYFTERCKKFVDSLTDERVFMCAKWMMEKTTATLHAYQRSIPSRIKADREMVSQLLNDNRSRDDVLKKYDPIKAESYNVQQRMLQLGFELCPARVDEGRLKWEENTKSVVRDEEFSITYRGELQNRGRMVKNDSNCSLQVAVKVFKQKFDDPNTRFYLNEESRIRNLDHKNVAKFYGALKVKQFKAFKNEKFVFVSSYYQKNMKQLIFEEKIETPGSASNLHKAKYPFLKWAKEIADGLNYIHERGLVHRFLKLENVSVDVDNTAKITDIGIVGQYRETEKSIVYLSPEVLRNLNVRSKESDVYSYGIMLWEMWYGVEVFNEIKPLEITTFQEKICAGYRPIKQKKKINLPEVEDIIESCWNSRACERPSAEKCRKNFQDMINELY